MSYTRGLVRILDAGEPDLGSDRLRGMKRSMPVVWALAVVGSVLFAGPARASCAPAPPLDKAYADAEVVFKGTVSAAENNGRTATVEVDEIWKGPPLPDSVVVIGGAEGENVASSVDREFRVGLTYLFFPNNSSSPFRDNICTSTQPYSPKHERLRDPSTSGPGDERGDPLPTTGSALFVWLGAAWLIMAAGALLLFARRRPKDRPANRL